MEDASQEPLTKAIAAATAARADVAEDATTSRFEAIYAAYVPLMRRIATRKFGVPRADADSLVHDVFATYLVNPGNVRDLHPYLIGAICNAARQYQRRGQREEAYFCGMAVCEATPDNELLDEVIRNSVVNAILPRLGDSCRETLRRFYLLGETAPVIARSRNTSANYILRLLHYCRKRFRAIYDTLSERA